MIVISTTVITLLLSAAIVNSVSVAATNQTESTATHKVPVIQSVDSKEAKKIVTENSVKKFPKDLSVNNSDSKLVNSSATAESVTTNQKSTTELALNDTHTEKFSELIPPAKVEPDIHYIRRSEIDV